MFKSVFIILLILFISGSVSGRQIDGLSEESNLYQKVFDIKLTTGGEEIHLSDIYHTSPVVVALIFTRCTGICNPFLLSLSENIALLNPKEKFRILVVSFDPRDKTEDLERLAKAYHLENNERWIFAITDQIQELNSSIGFEPIWDDLTAQFDHEALLTGINENGYIVRKQTGLREAKALSSLIHEINHAFILSYPLPGQDHLFSCFKYDPSTGQKKAAGGWIILFAPAFITFSLVILLSLFVGKD